jgi:hypothetical protein
MGNELRSSSLDLEYCDCAQFNAMEVTVVKLRCAGKTIPKDRLEAEPLGRVATPMRSSTRYDTRCSTRGDLQSVKSLCVRLFSLLLVRAAAASCIP